MLPRWPTRYATHLSPLISTIAGSQAMNAVVQKLSVITDDKILK